MIALTSALSIFWNMLWAFLGKAPVGLVLEPEMGTCIPLVFVWADLQAGASGKKLNTKGVESLMSRL